MTRLKSGKAVLAALLAVPVLLLLTACVGGGSQKSAPWAGALPAQGFIYVGTGDGKVVALDTESGRERWRFPEAGENLSIVGVYGAPVISQGILYVAANRVKQIGGGGLFGGGVLAFEGVMYALDIQKNGERLWETATDTSTKGGPSIMSGPALAGDTLIVGSADSYLYAFDLNGGRRWKFKTDEAVNSSPVVADGVAYFGSMDHNLYAIDVAACNASPDSCTEKWQFTAQGGFVGRPLVDQERVYIGSLDRNFYALDVATGNKVWRFTGAGSWFWAGAAASEALILAPSLDGKLYAIDRKDGHLHWEFPAGAPIYSTPVIVGDRVVVVTNEGTLSVLRLDSGRVDWTFALDVKVQAPLSAAGNVVYVNALNGTVYALDIAQKRRLWEEPVSR